MQQRNRAGLLPMKIPRLPASNDATRAIAVASSKGAIFHRKTRFCCIVASFLESSPTTPMRNGEYESTYQNEVVKQLKRMNALLLDHTDHLISIEAGIELTTLYLAALGGDKQPLKQALDRLEHAYADLDKKLRRSTRKALRDAI